MRQAVTVSGGEIKDILFCQHRPDENCECRKPKPGMILEARKRHRIDLSSACMVGDSAKDIMCARNAGCGAAVLVKTGNGPEAEKILLERKIPPDYVVKNLSAAVEWIISHT
jgi:D-glycero-D-manno-heptose 1,7-bisphosphate phosphatase